jgi:hypothetical protein
MVDAIKTKFLVSRQPGEDLLLGGFLRGYVPEMSVRQ